MSSNTCIKCAGELKPSERFRRRMCPRCYRRWVQDPNNRDRVKEMNRPLLERVKDRSVSQPNGCIHWMGHLNANGYGKISVNKTMNLVHRALYQELHGPLPEGMILDHTCHNIDLTCKGGPTCMHRRCVNLEHLEPVSSRENQARSINTTTGRSLIRNTCGRGHEYTPENTYVDRNGWKYCRACRRVQVEEARSGEAPNVVREFCRNGHRMTAENALIRGRHTRCRKCAAAVAQRIRDRKKGL